MNIEDEQTQAGRGTGQIRGLYTGLIAKPGVCEDDQGSRPLVGHPKAFISTAKRDLWGAFLLNKYSTTNTIEQDDGEAVVWVLVTLFFAMNCFNSDVPSFSTP